MSYADVELDLSSVQVACLTGPNGAGKSALLDAVTWALWEQARGPSDDLIRLGQREMWVDLVFSYEDRIYRIRRSRQRRVSRTGRRAASKGTLELMILTQLDTERRRETQSSVEVHATLSGPAACVVAPTSTDTEDTCCPPELRWKSMSGSSMRDTQQTIATLLRMDYDTFVNSAYLRQGKADEFTTRLPSERKQVLSEILGLSYFDRVRDAAKQRARDTLARLDVVEARLASRESIVERLAQASSQLELSSSKLSDKAKILADSQLKVNNLRTTIQDLRLLEQNFESMQGQVEDLKTDIHQLTSQTTQLTEQSQKVDALLEQSEEIEKRQSRFREIKDEVETLDSMSLEMQIKIEEKLRLQSELANTRSRLEVER
ncbi:MAG: SMC family ATPase, partial [Cyanobacteria bacterium]|nr:SMC family ATPase [Cyanobacteriota bacterium]